MKRIAEKYRETTETKIKVKINLDGEGQSSISSGIGFFDHMLTSFAKHSLVDLTVEAQGDLHIDAHHTIEDIGIVMGESIAEALGDREGINRFGLGFVPMDDALARAVVDFSGRAFLVYKTYLEARVGDFETILVKEFFRAFAHHSLSNIHIEILYGENPHHQIESMFKAFAIAFRDAVSVNQRIQGTQSTKGTLI